MSASCCRLARSCTPKDQDRAGSAPGYAGENTRDVAGGADVREQDRQAELPRRSLKRSGLGGAAPVGFPEDRHP
jgi:hypothetical protein